MSIVFDNRRQVQQEPNGPCAAGRLLSVKPVMKRPVRHGARQLCSAGQGLTRVLQRSFSPERRAPPDRGGVAQGDHAGQRTEALPQACAKAVGRVATATRVTYSCLYRASMPGGEREGPGSKRRTSFGPPPPCVASVAAPDRVSRGGAPE